MRKLETKSFQIADMEIACAVIDPHFQRNVEWRFQHQVAIVVPIQIARFQPVCRRADQRREDGELGRGALHLNLIQHSKRCEVELMIAVKIRKNR